ncbi:MAG: twin-arginine translocation signal domain-containing protein, partial [Deltaproteobacteria bacterium]
MTLQTRRDFLRTAGAAGMSLAVAPVFACEVKEETPFEG